MLPFPAREINEKLVTSFVQITSSSREEANSFLQTHRWDLDAAVSAFAERSVADESNVFNPSDQQLLRSLADRTRYLNLRVEIPDSSHSPSAGSSDHIPPESSPSRVWLRPPNPPNPSRARNPFSSNRRAADNPCTRQRRELAGNIRTLADISGGTDSDSDDGGEQSGTIMQDPKSGEDVDVKDKESDVERPAQSPRITFAIVTADEPQDEPQVFTFTVTRWRNGFTVDDSPLKTLDSPRDAEFLEIVESSESPRDVSPAGSNVRVYIKLIRRQDEVFIESPFHGVGRTLSEPDSASTEPPPDSSDSLTTEPPASSMSLVVDPAAPTTSVQLRLADGTRIVSRFNTHHTVRDVRGFIDASAPGGSNDYQLLIMGFPPKPLLDIDQTIENAGISNSVLIQKY